MGFTDSIAFAIFDFCVVINYKSRRGVYNLRIAVAIGKPHIQKSLRLGDKRKAAFAVGIELYFSPAVGKVFKIRLVIILLFRKQIFGFSDSAVVIVSSNVDGNALFIKQPVADACKYLGEFAVLVSFKGYRRIWSYGVGDTPYNDIFEGAQRKRSTFGLRCVEQRNARTGRSYIIVIGLAENQLELVGKVSP